LESVTVNDQRRDAPFDFSALLMAIEVKRANVKTECSACEIIRTMKVRRTALLDSFECAARAQVFARVQHALC
jgi:hypothetical protein